MKKRLATLMLLAMMLLTWTVMPASAAGDVSISADGRLQASSTVALTSSSWAASELARAQEYGLIPDSLANQDLRLPITREEFCALAVQLHDEALGVSTDPYSPNPFTDTSSPSVLKAYALHITTGTTATTFSPKTLVSREQCATLLFRTLKTILPDADYSVAGTASFPDQAQISSYALEAARFMAEKGIIKGDSAGNFMPRALTPAQTASGYGRATREAAILMAVRAADWMIAVVLDQYATTDDGTTDPSDDGTSTDPTEGTTGTSGTSDTGTSGTSDTGIVGLWSQDGASGSLVDPSTGAVTGSVTNGEWWLFRADGTFRYVIVSTGQIISGGVVQEGSYSVSGGRLTLSGVKESWYPTAGVSGQTPQYVNKAIDDWSVTWSISADGGSLTIDGTDTFARQ